MVEAATADAALGREQALLRGRVAILFALSQHYLFVPFAALCMAAALFHKSGAVWIMATPLVLQIGASVAMARLKRAYDERGLDDDSEMWAQRYTALSGFSGAIWGVGAIVWFVPNSYLAQAYLVLAYLGMTTAEFVVRAAYRPAYLIHALFSLTPLALLLVAQDGIYEKLTSVLVLFFAGVLYTYSGTVSELLDEGVLLRHDNAHLIVRLSQEKRAAELSRDAAQASERSKSTFISNISHEIRTPLNAILGMAQLLERAELEKAHRDHLKVLLDGGRGLKTLLDDIIALAEKGDEPDEMPDGGCDAGQIARTVARLLQPNAWEKRLRLSVNVAPLLPHAAADPRGLRRILLKLVGNAIKFTERGNIEIAADTVTSETGETRVRLRVIDTGPGIPSHLISAIFEPFAKADESYARRYNGAGVGLSVAKKLVETMGGAIGVESEPGRGASFWITIPTTQSISTEEIDSGTGATPPANLSMLALVSEVNMREQLERLLTPFGNRIMFADSLAQAATLATRQQFALILANAASVDALAAMPGQRTPILALAVGDERHPDGADTVLRWPSPASALYAAISNAKLSDAPRGDDGEPDPTLVDAAIDAKAFGDLEKSLGLKTLIDILQSYLGTAELLAKQLNDAADAREWPQAGRVAQDFAGAAGGLGLTALTSAARLLAQAARDGADAGTLGQAAQDVLSEHQRVNLALSRLYPDLVA